MSKSKRLTENLRIILVLPCEDEEGETPESPTSEADPSLQPPKGWWEKMQREIKSSNPDCSQEQVDSTIGSIWRDLPDSKKEEIRGREGKTYGPAEEEQGNVNTLGAIPTGRNPLCPYGGPLRKRKRLSSSVARDLLDLLPSP